MSLSEAFREVCPDAVPADPCYLSLYVVTRCYGGPEEGGWWYDRRVLESSQSFPTYDAARAALEKIQTVAAEKTREAARTYGNACIEQCNWCEARGLDADYLAETDGPDEYHVRIEDVRGEWTETDRPVWS